MDAPKPPWFDHERLDVYAAALDFVALAHDIIGGLPRGAGTLADQLTRAATSIALNTAEGSGEFSPKEKARFYRIAHRSAAECAGILDVASRQRIIGPDDARDGKLLLGRIAAMLTVLSRRHGPSP